MLSLHPVPAAIKREESILNRSNFLGIKELMRPRRLVKMLMPYGLLRLYQKRMEARHLAALPQADHRIPLGRPHQRSGEYWLQGHRHLQPMNLVRDEGGEKRLNLVISSLGRAQLFGGIATCTVVATMLATKLGLPLRIITRDGGATQEQYWAIMAVMGIEPCTNISFYSDSSRGHVGQNCPPLYFTDEDIFLASSWWTATAIRSSNPKRLYHIIQEDELMFYQRGDDFLDCWNALNSPDAKYIVNSKYLHDWFESAYPIIYKNSVAFEPVFGRAPSRMFPEKQKYNLFMYARLTNPRNLFWFGLRMLDECFKHGILQAKEWNIYLAGDDSIPELELFGGKRTINLGILSWEQYREFLLDVDLGLCLIHTPHPGYPVYDVASAGGVAVTNTLYNKQSFPCSDNIIACDLSEESFLAGMAQAVALAKDGSTRQRNYLHQQIPNSWTESLAEVVEFVRAGA